MARLKIRPKAGTSWPLSMTWKDSWWSSAREMDLQTWTVDGWKSARILDSKQHLQALMAKAPHGADTDLGAGTL